MRALLRATALALVVSGAYAFAYVEVGGKLPVATGVTLDGGRATIPAPGAVSLFVFFDPGQEHSQTLLAYLAQLQGEAWSAPVQWFGIVSSRVKPEDAKAALATAGVKLPTLIDEGDKLYGELGVRLYPSVGIADRDGVLHAYLPFEKINYLPTIRGQLKHVLGELTDAQLRSTLEPTAVKINSEAAQAERHLKLAGMLLDAGKLDAALDAAQKALALVPELAAAEGMVGAALAARGDCAAAKPHLEKALARQADEARAKAALVRCP